MDFGGDNRIQGRASKPTTSDSGTVQLKISEQECLLLSQEVVELLNKGAVEKADPAPDQLLGNLFLRLKKDGSHRQC